VGGAKAFRRAADSEEEFRDALKEEGLDETADSEEDGSRLEMRTTM